MPSFLAGGGACARFVTTDIVCYGGGELNQNRFRPNGRAERARRRVQGPTQASWWGPGTVGPNGDPGRGPGVEPSKAPGFLGFLRPENASPRIIFFFISQTSFAAAKSVDHVDIRYKMTRAHLFSSDRPTGR